MPWKEATTMELRQEFIQFATSEGANIRALCRRFGITPRTGYKWLQRYRGEGVKGLLDRSRRPHHSPGQTAAAMEDEIVKERDSHPVWGSRKLKASLEHKGHTDLPAPSTITTILKRHGKTDPEESKKHQAFQRFEMAQPNQLWQMDFKGYFGLSRGHTCHPLTVLDDHSRFLVGLQACPNETAEMVQHQLVGVFQRYGLPERILMDNGSPWGDDRETPYTVLGAWLIRLGIHISHGRPYHPQTQGKDERLHRTLKAEVISQSNFTTLEECQTGFDAWRTIYNFERPHEALQMLPPASRYQPSLRSFPTALPPIDYPIGDFVRKVDDSGKISFRNHILRVGKAFRHFPVGVRPSDTDGLFQVYFCSCKVAQFDLRLHNC
jgi:transposase InsO family protein